MIMPAVKDGKDCLKFTISKDRELYITVDEINQINCGIRIRELELGDVLSFEEFRQLKREYRKEERAYLQHGRLSHLSKYLDTVWEKLNEDYFKEHGRYPKQKGNTYVKSTEATGK